MGLFGGLDITVDKMNNITYTTMVEIDTADLVSGYEPFSLYKKEVRYDEDRVYYEYVRKTEEEIIEEGNEKAYWTGNKIIEHFTGYYDALDQVKPAIYSDKINLIRSGISKMQTDTQNLPEVMPDGKLILDVDDIPSGAYRGNIYLKELVINRFNNLGEFAFANCPNLRKVTFNNSFFMIPRGLFAQCPQLKEVIMMHKECLGAIDDYAFQGCTSLDAFIMAVPGKMKIQEITTFGYIGKGAFMNCISLTMAYFYLGLSYIGDMAFKGCCNLTDFKIPETVLEIGERAFEGCIKLLDFCLPQKPLYIGDKAFNGVKTVWASISHFRYKDEAAKNLKKDTDMEIVELSKADCDRWGAGIIHFLGDYVYTGIYDDDEPVSSGSEALDGIINVASKVHEVANKSIFDLIFEKSDQEYKRKVEEEQRQWRGNS